MQCRSESPVSHAEVHGQGPETAITGQSKCGMFVENLQVQNIKEKSSMNKLTFLFK